MRYHHYDRLELYGKLEQTMSFAEVMTGMMPERSLDLDLEAYVVSMALAQ